MSPCLDTGYAYGLYAIMDLDSYQPAVIAMSEEL